eukprot:363805-Chlamydomonas_euryale.AAC.3
MARWMRMSLHCTACTALPALPALPALLCLRCSACTNYLRCSACTALPACTTYAALPALLCLHSGCQQSSSSCSTLTAKLYDDYPAEGYTQNMVDGSNRLIVMPLQVPILCIKKLETLAHSQGAPDADFWRLSKPPACSATSGLPLTTPPAPLPLPPTPPSERGRLGTCGMGMQHARKECSEPPDNASCTNPVLP